MFPFFVTYNSGATAFLHDNIVYSVDNVFAQIPFFPKTPRQVLVRASLLSKDLNSYSVLAKIKVGNEQTDLINLSATGKIRRESQTDNRSQIKISGRAVTPVQTNLDFETVTIGDNLFFKSNLPLFISGFSTSKILGWYKLNLTEFAKNLKVDVRNEEEIINDVETKVQENIKQILDEKNLKQKLITENGMDFYEIKTKLKNDSLTKFLVPQNQDSSSDLTIKVEKETYNLSEIRLEKKGQKSVNVDFSYNLKDHNRVKEIEAPRNAQEVKNPVELYLLFNAAEKPTPESLLRAVGGETYELGTTLLTIERLTKVVLILPKAF